MSHRCDRLRCQQVGAATFESGDRTLVQATPWNRPGNDTRRIAQMNVSLRPVEDRDLDTIYQQVTDPESIRMAAFTAEDQTDRRAFLNRMSALAASCHRAQCTATLWRHSAPLAQPSLLGCHGSTLEKPRNPFARFASK